MTTCARCGCIGGRYNNNTPGLEPFVGVPKERQKEALAYLGRNVFEAPTWLFPDNIMSKTGTIVTTMMNDMQENVLRNLMSAVKLRNVENAGYPADEYLDDLFAEVWKDVNGNDLQAKMRRNLQRSYLKFTNALVNPAANNNINGNTANFGISDAELYMMLNLQKVEDFCKQRAQTEAGINKLHYEDLLREIKLIRDRRTTVK